MWEVDGHVILEKFKIMNIPFLVPKYEMCPRDLKDQGSFVTKVPKLRSTESRRAGTLLVKNRNLRKNNYFERYIYMYAHSGPRFLKCVFHLKQCSPLQCLPID